jgi:hypothetical protein
MSWAFMVLRGKRFMEENGLSILLSVLRKRPVTGSERGARQGDEPTNFALLPSGNSKWVDDTVLPTADCHPRIVRSPTHRWPACRRRLNQNGALVTHVRPATAKVGTSCCSHNTDASHSNLRS